MFIAVYTAAMENAFPPGVLSSHWSYHRRQVILIQCTKFVHMKILYICTYVCMRVSHDEAVNNMFKCCDSIYSEVQ